MNVVMNVDQRAVWSSDPHDLLSVLLWLPVVSVSNRSDNFVRVHGGRSEGRVGDEPAQAGRQRHRLGRPELWEVSLIFVWVGSPPTGFFFEATQICCVGFYLTWVSVSSFLWLTAGAQFSRLQVRSEFGCWAEGPRWTSVVCLSWS